MEVGGCGVLDMSRVYPKTLFGPMFYSWWNCPLNRSPLHRVTQHVQRINESTKEKLEEDITINEIEEVLFKIKN